MSVMPRKANGTVKYRVRYMGVDGKQYEKNFDRKRDADKFDRQQAEAKAESRAAALGLTVPVTLRLRVSSKFVVVVQEYIDASRLGRDGRAPLEPTTLDGYQSHLDRYIRPVFGDVTVEGMVKDDVRRALTALRGMTTAANAKRVWRVVKAAMNWAVDTRDMREASPIGTLDVAPEKKAKRGLPKTHTNEEINRMLICARTRFYSTNGHVRRAWFHYYPLLLILATTGLRSSEAFALKWTGLSADYTMVTVTEKVRRFAKGLTKDDRIGSPKSVYAFRTVPIPEQVAVILRERRPRVDSVWIFPDNAGGPKNYRAVREHMWAVLIREAGVAPLGMHALRHYAASLVIQKHGVHMLREFMGHHSAAFTMATYGGHLDDAEETKKKIGAMFGDRLDSVLLSDRAQTGRPF